MRIRVQSAALAFSMILGFAGPVALGDDIKKEDKKMDEAKTIYDFTVKDIDGEDVSLSKYKGDVLMIVNVASK